MENQAQIIKRIEALEKWKAERIGQQITFPLDFQSRTILNKYFLSKVANLTYEAGASGQTFKEILIQQDGKYDSLNAQIILIQYTADITTNILTLSQDLVNLRQGTLSEGTPVLVLTSGTAPSPLSGGYYVVNANPAETQIQLSQAPAGAPVDILTAGIGNQYLSIL